MTWLDALQRTKARLQGDPSPVAVEDEFAQPEVLSPPLRIRFQAWWEGVEVAELWPPRPKKAARRAVAAADEELKRLEAIELANLKPWSPERLSICEQLWGDGFLTPGGAPYVLKVTKPLALDSSMTIGDVGAGLGGAARTMAETYGVWVTGVEPVAEIAEIGMKMSKGAFEKKAPVRHHDMETIEFKPRGYNALVSFEALYKVKDKARLLGAIQRSLKSEGHFVFTDYVLPQAAPHSPAVDEWLAKESDVHPWSAKEALACLGALPFDIRQAEDESDQHRNRILAGWAGFVGKLKRETLSPKVSAVIMQEAEIWMRRVQLLEKNEIRFFRFHILNQHIRSKPASISWG